MSSKTKIVVLHMKEIIYTGIFLLFLIVLGVLMFFMFDPGKAKSVSTDPASVYTPGIYRSSIELNGNSFDVEVTVDAQKIRSMTDEELAKLFEELCYDSMAHRAKYWLHWLQQPAEEEPK